MESSEQIEPGDRVLVRHRYGTGMSMGREATVLSVSKPRGFIGTAMVRWRSQNRLESDEDFERPREYFLDKLTALRRRDK